jgi:hypothetical protein
MATVAMANARLADLMDNIIERPFHAGSIKVDNGSFRNFPPDGWNGSPGWTVLNGGDDESSETKQFYKP